MGFGENFLTVEDLSSILNVTPQHIRSLIRRGKITAIKSENNWLIDSKTLEDKNFIYTILPDVPNQIRRKKTDSNIIALSFFSGAMGLDIGLSKEGIEVLLASEIDPSTRKTILLNKPDIGLIGDIENFSSDDIRKYAGLSKKQDIDLIVGGPPCQAFSTAGRRGSFNDERGNVFLTFIDRILELRPKIAVIENVRGLLSAPIEHRPHLMRGEGYQPLLKKEKKGGALMYIIQLLEKGGYEVSFNLYNSANFGSPQKRERVVIFCTRNGVKAPFLTPTHSENGLFGLPKWKTFEEVTKNLKESEQEYLKFPEDRLFFYKMLKPGQYWKHLPEKLQKKALGKSFYSGGGKTGFLRRLAWDQPAPTLVTDPTLPATDLAHPVKDRPLSVKEYMRIQEFPDNWHLWGGIKDKYKQIGNAVPVSLGRAIGKHIKKLLREEKIKTYELFPYSRYKYTDHNHFHLLIKKEKQLEVSI